MVNRIYWCNIFLAISRIRSLKKAHGDIVDLLTNLLTKLGLRNVRRVKSDRLLFSRRPAKAAGKLSGSGLEKEAAGSRS